MNELNLTLNNLRSINEKLSSIPDFAVFNWVNNKKVYMTKLFEISNRLTLDLPDSINLSKLNKVIRKWSEYKEHKELTFTLKELEILSSQSDIVQDEDFWELLLNIEKFSARLIRYLVFTTHNLWNEIDNFERIIITLQSIIFNYDGNDKIINLWKNNLKLIMDIDLPKLISKYCLKNNISVMTFSKEYYLNLSNSNLGNVINETLFDLKLSQFVQNKNISTKDVIENTEIINKSNYTKNKKDEFLAKIIFAVDSTQISQNKSIEYLKTLLLQNIYYKDPRKYSEKWLNFDNNALAIFIKWLNEQDIKVFFNLFIANDPHNRKNFWLNYANSIRKTTILENKTLIQNIRNKSKIQDLANKGIEILDLNGTPATNAFILEFDNLAVVEFSEVGNACYVYNINSYRKQIKESLQGYSITKLKNKEHATKIISHTSGWNYRLKNWLASKGIR